MGKTFKQAHPDDQAFLEDVRAEFEPELQNAGVRVKLMFAQGTFDKNGTLIPPLVRKGVRSIAEVKINSLKERAEGLADATITYDFHFWEEHNDARRRAVLHHELHHLKTVQGKYGLERDDLERPVLKMRNHDFEVGWFRCIAEIHGDNAVEVQQARLLVDPSGQLLFPWAPDAEKELRPEEKEARSKMRKEKSIKARADAASVKKGINAAFGVVK